MRSGEIDDGSVEFATNSCRRDGITSVEIANSTWQLKQMRHVG